MTTSMRLESGEIIGKLCLLKVQKSDAREGHIYSGDLKLGDFIVGEGEFKKAIYIVPCDVLLTLDFSKILISQNTNGFAVWLPDISAEQARVDRNEDFDPYTLGTAKEEDTSKALLKLLGWNQFFFMKTTPDLVCSEGGIEQAEGDLVDALRQKIMRESVEDILKEARSPRYIDRAKRQAENIVASLIRLGEGRGMTDIQFQWYWGQSEWLNWVGLERNKEEALRWIREAAKQGNPEAQFHLGCFYHDGDGVEKNMDEALHWIHKAVQQGSAAAQNELGMWYFTGDGVKKDDDQASNWFRMAAQQGYANAQCNLGRLEANISSTAWFRIAAEQGDAEGQFLLGTMYMTGYARWDAHERWKQYKEGKFRDSIEDEPYYSAEAVKWFKMAAAQGHTLARYCVQARVDDTKRRQFICDTFRRSGIDWGNRFCLVNSNTWREDHPMRDNAVEEINTQDCVYIFAKDVLFWDVPPAGDVSHVLVTSTGLFVRNAGEGQAPQWEYWPFEDIQTIDWERPPNECVVLNGTKRRIVLENGTEFVASLKKILERVRSE